MSKKKLPWSKDTIISFPRCVFALLVILATLAAVFPGPAGPRPAAANDDPVISGNTATYSGNQQPSPITQNNTNIYTINVQDLTTNVGSPSTGTSISLTSTGAAGENDGDSGKNSQALSLNYSGGDNYLYGNSYGANVNTTGGAGHSGKNNKTNQDGGDGGAGGTAGTVIVNMSGNIQVSGTGIAASSNGGAGGQGGDASGTLNQYGGDGGAGGDGNAVTITNNGSILSVGTGINASSSGGTGGNGGEGGYSSGGHGHGGDGGQGGNSGNIQIENSGSITTTGASDAYGIQAVSQGGQGGSGGEGHGVDSSYGHHGGDGGTGGIVGVLATGPISTSGASSYGIYALSQGGAGGVGGEGAGTVGYGGGGGTGGAAGNVGVIATGAITTSGASAHGINAQSIGGNGGESGTGTGVSGYGGAGGDGGAGGNVAVIATGAISTSGAGANGINTQSSGGKGGSSPSEAGLNGGGGAGGNGGEGGSVTVTNYGAIKTSGANAFGINAQSLGGTGANGASGDGSNGIGGNGGNGGDSGQVTVKCKADITTNGQTYAINAVSQAGNGGNGGDAGGISASGGSAGSGGSSEAVGVIVDPGVTLTGGIVAQSLGGVGGKAHSSTGIGAIGGTGGGGGGSGQVSVTCNGSITADGVNGILAQSIGGIGGAGGNVGSAGGAAGIGGAGGGADIVQVTCSGNIGITGNQVNGILAQSQGGSGGPGGSAAGMFPSPADAGASGVAGTVSVTMTGSITTTGTDSCGIQAQSLGGTGGSGGSGYGIISWGGDATAGADGGQVTVNSGSAGNTTGYIQTQGAGSTAIFAQSLGGGGGNGGTSVSMLAIGGTGAAGGDGGTVGVTNYLNLTTAGNSAYGIFAQSEGGGGGNGGGAVSLAVGVGLSLGGSGATGGEGGTVSVTNYGGISTSGTYANGIFAQSLGGGGGNGGWSVTAGTGITAGIGGYGGVGGSGNLVQVDNSGTITTTNDHSQGIFAQSTGGGGGNGGWTFSGNITPILSENISLGGNGGIAGDGGKVEVKNTGSIFTGSSSTNNGTTTTLGYKSCGIQAQSVGGGGGNAGWAGSGTISFSVPDIPVSAGISVALGGSGGAGGNGGEVEVVNLAPTVGSSSIVTLGDDAHGIFAQSLGGGGGSGGGSVAVGCDFSGKSSYQFQSNVAVGGNGGSGGTGGKVGVVNENAITTYGSGSLGIFAQSLGGSGGEGGWSVTAGLSGAATNSFEADATVTLGGKGANGGNAGEVGVANTGAITTYGQGSIGIEAQSVGGSGGNGGWSIAADAAIGNTNSVKPAVTVGGLGGGGGTGGNVAVVNGLPGTAAGAITTFGDQAEGILAQSIGGGGGKGGATALFTIKGETGNNNTLNLTPQVAVGGSGGTGNTGGTVNVYNYAAISTAGTWSYGIFAQSVGGGGGKGGASHIMTVSTAATNLQTMSLPNANIQASASVGGSGGSGNLGGTVTVNNSGGITTQGMQAYGIFAQSVGGGGGVGGSSYDFSAILALSKAGNKNNNASGLNINEYVSVGGNGGNGSHGGTVTVNNSGAINTSGSSAYGIFAQSVGGGGGAGGSSASGLAIPSSDYNDWTSWVIPSISQLTFEVGGNGGGSSNGGEVTVNNSGAITTSGNGAFGIYAQSLGGGGGVANYDQSQMFTDTNNNGGQVNPAILPGTIEIGGKGGAGGDGNTVQVTNSGVINTYGNQASGIYAQSIGGGGGNGSIIGGAWNNVKFLQYFGFAIDMGRTGGIGGNGGWVNVTNFASDITTRGDNANGIFAQSVGGAGGSGSKSTQICQGFLWNGSFLSGASGTGGQVNVSQTGNITTYGDDSHGIVAQSITAQDAAVNPVQIVVNDPGVLSNPQYHAAAGNIAANGLGSCGIVAQNLGHGGNGEIDITINQPSAGTGMVQGGHTGTVTNADGTTTAYNAYGVLIMDGKDNKLNNYGSISTLDGVGGTAVMVQASYGSPAWGDLTINNHGTITGSVNQGAQASSPMNNDGTLTLPSGHSDITFNNYQGGTYNAGPVINLGAGGVLLNSGILSLGTTHSTLTGSYTQFSTGTFQTTVNGDGSIGQLNVSGMVQLAGTLQVLKGTGPFKDGTSSSFLTGTTTGNFTNLILPTDTSLVNFSVQYTGASSPSGSLAAAGANAVQIVSHVKSHTTVATGSTQAAVGGYLDQLLAGNPTGNIALILEELQKMAPSQFATAFESLNPGVYGANADTTFAITRQYARTLQQRLAALRAIRWEEAAPQALSDRPFPLLAFNGANASLGQVLGRGQDDSGWVNDRLGFWIEGFGQWGSQGALDGVSGYNYGGAGTGVGLDYAVTKNLIIGANFGYSYSNLIMDNSVGNGKINSLYGSLYGTYFTERAYVEGVLSYGHHRYDNSRRVSIGALQSSNQSSHTGNAFSVLTEAGYKFPVQPWNFQPFVSLNYCNLTEGRFEESGALATMQVDGRSTNSLVSELGTQVDRPIRTSKGTLVPMVKVGWQHDFGVSKNSVPFTLVGAPVGVTITQPRVSQDRAAVKAGLTFKAKGGVTSSIQYMGEVGEKTQNHGVIGQVRIAF